MSARDVVVDDTRKAIEVWGQILQYLLPHSTSTVQYSTPRSAAPLDRVAFLSSWLTKAQRSEYIGNNNGTWLSLLAWSKAGNRRAN